MKKNTFGKTVAKILFSILGSALTMYAQQNPEIALSSAPAIAGPNDVARFLAGMPVPPSSPLAPLTRDPAWQALVADQPRSSMSGAVLKSINDALVKAERALIDSRGLRGRTWYKHEIYAPGIYTGYAAQPLTDFQQALDDRNTTNAKESLERVVEAIKRATNVLRKARD